MDEVYSPDVKRTWQKKYSELQFWGCFAYNAKGPRHVWFPEEEEEKWAAKLALEEENEEWKGAAITKDESL